jgi:hypothetical protein
MEDNCVNQWLEESDIHAPRWPDCKRTLPACDAFEERLKEAEAASVF